MDNLEKYRDIIEQSLSEYTKIPYSYSDIKTLSVFDRNADRYLLIEAGWDKDGVRVSGLLVHVALKDGKIWIHYDGTEDGVAADFEAAGVPKSQIVLGFHPPEIRPYTEYAAA